MDRLCERDRLPHRAAHDPSRRDRREDPHKPAGQPGLAGLLVSRRQADLVHRVLSECVLGVHHPSRRNGPPAAHGWQRFRRIMVPRRHEDRFGSGRGPLGIWRLLPGGEIALHSASTGSPKPATYLRNVLASPFGRHQPGDAGRAGRQADLGADRASAAHGGSAQGRTRGPQGRFAGVAPDEASVCFTHCPGIFTASNRRGNAVNACGPVATHSRCRWHRGASAAVLDPVACALCLLWRSARPHGCLTP